MTMKVEVSPRFKGLWIPREIWLDQTMTLLEKCVLAEIDSLAVNSRRCCTASNRYLATFFQVTDRHIKRPIAALAKRGLLRIELIRTEPAPVICRPVNYTTEGPWVRVRKVAP